ncbi:MAG: AtpZ/AtpI family protein [Dehalococcoidales bacterium]|jgi:F0F1-type ATP synthase assembly protein I
MNRWAAALRLTGIGFYIAACILIGIFAGQKLDSKVHTAPLFILLGLVLGLGMAVFGVYRMIRPLIDKQGKENGQ